ncbi:MAG: hypothetical protein AB1631_10125 [Acidobacteriota bacterium]
MLSKIYLAIGLILLLGYGLVAFTGMEFGDPRREVVPPEVRNSPGGYRSFHFWHSGYRGGK